jgi:hypothetical protein
MMELGEFSGRLALGYNKAMARDPRVDLLAELPAGEWADVKILNQPPGMMAGRNWAILAKAKWLRKGGRAAFVKFIIPAGSDAGLDTEMVTGRERLKRLCERLQSIGSLGGTVPLVPLLEVKLTAKGLLIAMEEVRPLHEIIERGESYSLSLRVLRDLDPEIQGRASWLHFDICPLNIGVLHNERCVLIDVESFYLEEGDRYDVSVPAWKSFRAPQFLREEVASKLAGGTTDRSLAIKKVGFEVALAAAECVLGPLPPSRGEFDESLLDQWTKAAVSSDPAVAFWRKELRSTLRTGQIRSIRELAQDLEAALRVEVDTVHAPRVAVPILNSQSGSDAVDISLKENPIESVDVSPGWETDWLMLKPSAHALRTGKFDRVRVSEYRLALERLVHQYPKKRELWDELLLLTVSYQKDPVGALAVVVGALKHFPNDAGFERQRNIIQMWVMERQK